MNIYNFKDKKNSNKGITLMALIITIILMLLIIGISVSTGLDSLESTRLSAFYAQLEIIQKRVDDIASNNEKYIDSSGKVIYLKNQGIAYTKFSPILKRDLEKIINDEGDELGLKIENFRYFSKETLESELELMDVPYNVFIDFNTRTVIAREGITINGKDYHILFNETYFVEKDESKIFATVTELIFSNPIAYGEKNYKVSVTPKNAAGGVVLTGTLRYKKIDTRYWETVEGLEIRVDELARYNIEYEDSYKNTISATIGITLRDGIPYTAVY